MATSHATQGEAHMFRTFINGLPFGPLLFDEEGEGGSGGGGPDRSAQLEALEAKHGSTKAALAQLYDENYRLRSDKRDLKKQLKEAELPEGSVVLTAEQAKELEAYKALGKPEDLKASLEEHDELKTKVQQGDRRAEIAEVAKAAGWEGKEAVLSTLVTDGDKLEIRDETVDGETVKVPYITLAGEGKVPTKLVDHATKEWKDFLPALGAKGDTEDEGGGQGGTRFPGQKPTGKAPAAGDAFDRAIGSRYSDSLPSKRKAS